MKVVIVGGVAGGATAAARIRRLDEQAQITVFERSHHISYANCFRMPTAACRITLAALFPTAAISRSRPRKASTRAFA